MSEWLPIDDVPEKIKEDGVSIDLHTKYRRFPDCFFATKTGRWVYEDGHESGYPLYSIVEDPTHWMFRPESPYA